MKPGPRPMPDSFKLVRGTLQPSRRRGEVVPALEGEPAPPPAWLKGYGRRLWAVHLATYR